MKINWNPNPLCTYVDVDLYDRERMLIYHQNDEYVELMCRLDDDLSDNRPGSEPLTIEQIRDRIVKWQAICNTTVDCTQITLWVQDLQDSHGGDCTCWAASCMKCHAEEALGINTIKGLGKHEASWIQGLFGAGLTIDQVIDHLKRPKVYVKPDNWPEQMDYNKHIPRWEAEKQKAANWLEQYKQTHGF